VVGQELLVEARQYRAAAQYLLRSLQRAAVKEARTRQQTLETVVAAVVQGRLTTLIAEGQEFPGRVLPAEASMFRTTILHIQQAAAVEQALLGDRLLLSR
jgi:hypothetical protein